MLLEELKQNVTVYGPLFPEPVQIHIAVPMGNSVELIGKDLPYASCNVKDITSV